MSMETFTTEFVQIFVKDETSETLSDAEDDFELEQYNAETLKDDLTLLEVAIATLLESANPAHFWRMICPRCGKEFATAPLWQQHLDNAHYYNNLKMLPVRWDEIEGSYMCRKCDATFQQTDYRKILLHCLTHMRHNAYYKCTLCEHLLSTESQMQQHIKRHIQVHLLKAKIDNKILKTKKIMLNNEVNYENYLRYVCPSCGLHFPTQRHWWKHTNKEHQLFAPEKLNFNTFSSDKESDSADTAVSTTCNICGLTLLCKKLRVCQIKHYLMHLRFRAFRCTLCKMRLNYYAEIKMHMQLLHCKNRQYFERTVLPAVVRNVKLPFDLHRSFVLGEGAKYAAHWYFYCPMCGVRFRNSENWYAHINANHDFFKPAYMALVFSEIKSNSKNGKFVQCYTSKGVRHVPYCLICNRRVYHYIGHRCLWAEQLRHMPHAPFGCSICDITFPNLLQIMRHFRAYHIHSDGTIKTEKIIPKTKKTSRKV